VAKKQYYLKNLPELFESVSNIIAVDLLLIKKTIKIGFKHFSDSLAFH